VGHVVQTINESASTIHCDHHGLPRPIRRLRRVSGHDHRPVRSHEITALLLPFFAGGVPLLWLLPDFHSCCYLSVVLGFSALAYGAWKVLSIVTDAPPKGIRTVLSSPNHISLLSPISLRWSLVELRHPHMAHHLRLVDNVKGERNRGDGYCDRLQKTISAPPL